MPFFFNGIVLIQGNLPKVILVFTLKSAKLHYNYASFFIPYFNFLRGMAKLFLHHLAGQPL